MTNRKQKRKPEPSPKPEAPKVQHSPGGIKGRWLVNSLSFVLVILAVVVILISVGVSGYYYATVRDNLASRAATTSDTFRKYFTDTYDQFYTQAEATVTTFQDQDKFEQQFLDANGRILLSTSGLSGGGVASTEDASQALSGQKTAVFTGRDPLSGERVMSVTAPLLSARGDLVGGVRYITSLRIVERQIWMIVGFSLLACLLFLMLVVASNSYFIRSIVDPVLKINTIAKEIAAGRYGVRLQKTYDDEIGELCDTINYMSDEISRAERMKNDFISSVSHELRTPLTAIGGWSETLLAGGGEDPEEVMQGLTIIQKEAGRLTRMVEELLDFARIESGRMKLEVENFDLSIELYEAVYMYENLLQKSGIRLNYDEDVEANYFVNGDRHRMKQVFLNILDNAAKYGGDGKRIDIRQGRHPVIETLMPVGEEYIPNDVVLDDKQQQIMMITGPNMSGKSALLRQTALIILMAQMGSYVPAKSAHIGYVDKIFTRVGASDNISQGESTFMVEMLESASILNNISDRSIVLLDEIGRGTSTYDGISIAWAMVEYLHNHPSARAKTLFATHYHELNEMEQMCSRVKNYHVSVKEMGNQIVFLRKLERGGTEHSFGIHVARMAGMPVSIVSRADEILRNLELVYGNNEIVPSRSLKERGRKSAAQAVKEAAESAGPQNMQLSMFQLDDPVLVQIRDQIKGLDINSLTPIEALNKLNEIKKITGI